jgi:hypothetical protein
MAGFQDCSSLCRLAHRVLMTGLATIALTSPAAGSPDLTENVAVPGGLAALARAIDIDTLDRALCVPQLVRVAFSDQRRRLDREDSVLTKLLAYFKETGTRGEGDLVPMPLSARIWSQAVFRRAVSPAELLVAVMSDQRAAFVAHGLAALDDETLAFVANHPAIVTRLFESDATVFAAFAAHLHIRNNHVVPPGGDRAVPLWEALLNEQVSRPEQFIAALFSREKGRVAYLFDAVGHLDAPQAAFALGFWIGDARTRIERFKALAMVATSAFSEWDATKIAFSRPAHDLVALLSQVQTGPDGTPRPPSSRGVWARVFDRTGWPEGSDPSLQRVDDDAPVDAAWLAEALMAQHGVFRSEHMDQFAFGQRRFADIEVAGISDAIIALRAFCRFRMLTLTLDRVGINSPRIYASLARHAHQISVLNQNHAPLALAQFQGALALITRLVRVRTIDRGQAEKLFLTLAAVPLDASRGYAGALAVWIRQQLGPALTITREQRMDDAVLSALAGTARASSGLLVWEGQPYRFDLVATEAQRIDRARGDQANASIDAALDLQRGHRPASLERDAEFVGRRIDATLAKALTILSYAAEWDDVRASRGAAASVAMRHDFGSKKTSSLARVRMAWALPKRVIAPGVPWHVEGSMLGLDIALAPLGMRRITNGLPPAPPTLNANDRETLIATFGLMNAFALDDGTRDLIAEAVGRGERRVQALVERSANANEISLEINMDGWRARALQWTTVHDPQRILSFFSMTDLLTLGGGRDFDLHAWGMSSIPVDGRLCTRMASLRWPALVGRPQVGLLTTAVPDLNLRIAVMLHQLQLPAGLAKWVLAGAIQDYVDGVRPSDPDDWLTLVRAGRQLSRERIEDYIAAATVGGPLVPQATTHFPEWP